MRYITQSLFKQHIFTMCFHGIDAHKNFDTLLKQDYTITWSQTFHYPLEKEYPAGTEFPEEL